MSASFKNPANGYVETVGLSQSVFVVLFGAAYLAICGLWGHAFIWIALVVPVSVATGGAGLFLMLPIMSVVYAVSIQGILRKKYLRQGWAAHYPRPGLTENSQMPQSYRQTQHRPPPPERQQEESVYVTRVLSDEPQEKPAPVSTTKTCPFCAEDILVAAIKCKHCGSSVPA